MIPAQYICVPIAVILLVIVVMWRMDHGRHETHTFVYRERTSTKAGFEEEQ